MTNTPVSYLSNNQVAIQGGKTSSQDTINAHLYQWVSTCLDRGEQHLDTMVVTAPEGLKLAFKEAAEGLIVYGAGVLRLAPIRPVFLPCPGP